jgi:hypothetical protein
MSWAIIILLVLILLSVGRSRGERSVSSRGYLQPPSPESWEETRLRDWQREMRTRGAVELARAYRCRVTGRLIGKRLISEHWSALSPEERDRAVALMQAQADRLVSGTATWIDGRVVLSDKRGKVKGYR